jgi:hypothetical protein
MTSRMSPASRGWLIVTLVFVAIALISLFTASEDEDRVFAGYPVFDLQARAAGDPLGLGITTLVLEVSPGPGETAPLHKGRPVTEVIALAEGRTGGRLRYSLEPEAEAPAAFAETLASVLREAGVAARGQVRSLDWRLLRRLQEAAPEILAVYLTSESGGLDNVRRGQAGESPWSAGFDVDAYDGSLPRAIHAAGGRVWGPRVGDLRANDLAEAHRLGLKVLVWDVESPEAMEGLLDQGADGILTGRPASLRDVMAGRGMALPPPYPEGAGDGS